MNVEASLKKLFSLHTFGIKLGLENTIKFLEHIGNPQNFLKTIHVAGSNAIQAAVSHLALPGVEGPGVSVADVDRIHVPGFELGQAVTQIGIVVA